MAKKTAKTASERASERRADLIAKGYAQKNFLLSPAGQSSLAQLMDRGYATETEAVEAALSFMVTQDEVRMSNERLLRLVARRLRPDGGI